MKTRRFQKMRTRFLGGLLSIGLSVGLAGSAAANPSGHSVRHGEVNIAGGTHAVIQQLTDRAIVDWQSFSVGLGESVQFLQPSQLSVILNRVTGVDPSLIQGQLTANGNVFLINPNGILFGPTSVVNVGGLVASSLNITDQDFLAGNYNFFQDQNQALAAVVNQGQITITDAGYAVLVAPTVINEGTIVARTGNVVLASGEQATLNLDGRDLVHFSLSGEVSDGTVLLAPGMLSETIAQTLGVPSTRRADQLTQMPDGSYRLVSSSGTLVQAGTVSADGRDHANAGNVLLDSADYTLLTGGSLTSASGVGVNSSAGEVRVLSNMEGGPPGLTTFQEGATIAARGGESGDAGFIEVSGNQVKLEGELDFTRVDGRGGTFLLDPGNTRIVETAGSESGITYVEVNDILDLINSGTLYDLQSSGFIELETDIVSTGSGSLTLDATLVEDENNGTYIDLGNHDIDIGGALTLKATDDILIGSGTIVADRGFEADAGGKITITGATIDTQNQAGSEDGGHVHLTAGGDVSITGTTIRFEEEYDDGGAAEAAATLAINSTGGNILVEGSTFISDFSGTQDNPTYFSHIDMDATGNITITDTEMRAKDILLDAGGSVTQAITEGNESRWVAGTDIKAEAGGNLTVVRADAGQSVSLTSQAGSVDITNADIMAGTEISVLAESNGDIIGDADSEFGLKSPRIILNSVNGSVTAAIDTTSGKTKLSAYGQNSVVVNDIAPEAEGIILTPTITPTPSAAASSIDGDVKISTLGTIEADPDPSDEVLEVHAPNGGITLEGFQGVGTTSKLIDVLTPNLTVKAEGPNAPIGIRSEEDSTTLQFIDFTFNGGDVVLNSNELSRDMLTHNSSGLQMDGTAIASDTVTRLTSLADLAINGLSLQNDQFVVLNASDSSLLSGGASPNIIASGGNTFLALFADEDIGSQSAPLSVQSDSLQVNASGSNSNIFLALTPDSGTTVTLEGADESLTTNDIDNLTPPSSIPVTTQQGDIVVGVTGGLAIPGGVESGGNVSIDATGDVNSLGFDLTGTDKTLLINAASLNNSVDISADNLGLSLSSDFGSEATPVEIDRVKNLAIGSTSGTDYFLSTNGGAEQEVTLTGSLSFRNKSISGNRADTFHLENNGDISVATRLRGNTEIFLNSSDDIIQRPNGLLEAPGVLLEADNDIGAIDNDLQILASTLSPAAGHSLYIQNIGSDPLTIVNNAKVSNAGTAGDEFRVRSDLSDLTVSTDIEAYDVALVAGTQLQIPAQLAVPPNIILNNDVTAGDNLVLVAQGNVIQNGGRVSSFNLGLGANGTVGTPGSPIVIEAQNLSLYSSSSNLSSSPDPVNSVTSVEVTVNQGNPPAPTPPIDPTPPPTPVTPETPPGPQTPPGERFFSDDQPRFDDDDRTGSEFAQNDVDLVEKYTQSLIGSGQWDFYYEDVLIPLNWWDDEDLLKRKFRNRTQSPSSTVDPSTQL